MNKTRLSQRVIELPESATIAMAEKARSLSQQGIDIISLSLGEPDFDTPQVIKEAAKVALDEGYTKYTPVPGLLELRESICQKFKRDNGLDYNPANILVSNGAKQCIANACLALIDPGDEIVILSPYWVSYDQIAQISGAKAVYVKAGIESDFKVSPEQLEEAITPRTKLIIYSSPSNPTGSVYSRVELAGIAQVIERNPHVHVLSDEIYEYINYQGSHASIAEFDTIRDRVIVVNGLSKAFSMTGWRLGYMAASTPLIKACAKVQGQFTSGANAFGQRAAIKALELGKSAAREMYVAFQSRKELVRKLLSEIPGFQVNDPAGAFYFFPDISSLYGKAYQGRRLEGSIDVCDFLLEEASVAAVPGVAFGDDRYLRISYAASEEDLREACERIHQAVLKLSS